MFLLSWSLEPRPPPPIPLASKTPQVSIFLLLLSLGLFSLTKSCLVQMLPSLTLKFPMNKNFPKHRSSADCLIGMRTSQPPQLQDRTPPETPSAAWTICSTPQFLILVSNSQAEDKSFFLMVTAQSPNYTNVFAEDPAAGLLSSAPGRLH